MVEPAGSLSLSLALLRDTFAASPTWRACCANPAASWSTIATAAGDSPSLGDAKTRIGFGDVADPSGGLPRALVKHLPDETVDRDSTDGHTGEGMKVVVAWLDAPTAYRDSNGYVSAANASDCYLDMMNRAGSIRDELLQVSSQTPGAGVMDINSIEVADCGAVDENRSSDGPPRVSQYQIAFLVHHYAGD